MRWAGIVFAPYAVVQYSRHHCTGAAVVHRSGRTQYFRGYRRTRRPPRARRTQLAGRPAAIAVGTQDVALSDAFTVSGDSVGAQFAAAWPPRTRWTERPFCVKPCG